MVHDCIACAVHDKQMQLMVQRLTWNVATTSYSRREHHGLFHIKPDFQGSQIVTDNHQPEQQTSKSDLWALCCFSQVHTTQVISPCSTVKFCSGGEASKRKLHSLCPVSVPCCYTEVNAFNAKDENLCVWPWLLLHYQGWYAHDMHLVECAMSDRSCDFWQAHGQPYHPRDAGWSCWQPQCCHHW